MKNKLDEKQLTDDLMQLVSTLFCDDEDNCCTICPMRDSNLCNMIEVHEEGTPLENRFIDDGIHQPDHYTWKGTECKDVIAIMCKGLSEQEAFYMGNIIKYLYRYPKKGTLTTDLMKAEEYIHLLRALFEQKTARGGSDL